jgi:hypothetical protein
MTLRDRLRRWWNPAQWDDDHPTERTQRAQPKKNALNSWFGQTAKFTGQDDDGIYEPAGRTGFVERDFKKPRP